ncbi:hypothetical protein BY458DRAFT_500683 [Sporodiniella umbellata]|nr:hypothetical protein BY458DRAFT_500683 [Sporodiniella umbellata]
MSKKRPENRSLFLDADPIENQPVASGSDDIAELPSYNSVVAGSSQYDTPSLSGKPPPQHNTFSSTSDSDHCSLPMPLPSCDLNTQGYPPFPSTVENNSTTQSEDLPHSAIEMDQHEHLLAEEDQYRARPAPPGYSIYNAESKTLKDGNVVSRDKHINEDREALSQFMYRNNTKPDLFVVFYGSHEEVYYETRIERNTDGENVTVRERKTREVDDFDFKVDLSDYVIPTCRGVYALPDSKSNELKTVSGLCDDYIKSISILKELRLKKEVTWDFDRVITAMKNAIMSTNACEKVRVSFSTTKDTVSVKSNHWYSKLMDNNFFTAFMIISCIWIFIIPFNYLYKRNHSKLRIKSEWLMNVSEQAWYETHAREIMTMCISKTMRGSKPFKLITQLRPMPKPSPSMNAPHGPWF